MKKLSVGIIGCGTIGSEIAKACQDRLRERIELAAICDIDGQKALALQSALANKVPVMTLDSLIEKADLVVEAASAKVSADVVEKALKKRKAVLVMSVGGLLGKEALLGSARKTGARVYLPSGALCGIDGLKSAAIGRIDSVTLTTRKPPRGLEGAPYLKERNIDVSAVKGETVVFEGNALEAVKGFPANVNVCAVLSLAGIGAEKTRVRIVTSPEYTKNIHEVEITGDCGKVTTRTENVPSKTNPKTSALAFLSAIATLEGVVNDVRIGT
ncbi:MAG: aspartate dehydrogenase [Candidatus Omnitrophica bacterium]|nr:aspartate dehydrogenase [Candidatus Omnitrophota bacterium]